jgi:hypothetical protein
MHMSWVEDEYKEGPRPTGNAASTPSETRADEKWTELVTGLQADVQDFSRLGGNASFQKVSDLQCRVSNSAANVAVVLTADPSAQMIRYAYEPEGKEVAVPEGGVLTVRTSGGSAQLYSADQSLTSEDARRLILEPMLFPTRPSDLEATGT